jgi:hypothetical protein
MLRVHDSIRQKQNFLSFSYHGMWRVRVFLSCNTGVVCQVGVLDTSFVDTVKSGIEQNYDTRCK